MRIAADQLPKCHASIGIIAQIILVYLADGQQCLDTVLAARIFAAKELVMPHGGVQSHVIFEVTTHLRREFGHCKGAAFGFAGSWRFKHNPPVRRDYSFVLTASARLVSAAFESLTLCFSLVELSFGPSLGTMNSGLRSPAS